MMNKLKFEMDFANSKMLSYQSNGEDRIMFVLSGKDHIIKFQFIESIAFVARINWSISNIIEIENSGLLREAIKSYYMDGIDEPESHLFKHYQFLDNQDHPSIQVIARDVIISWPSEDDIPANIKNVDRVIPNDKF